VSVLVPALDREIEARVLEIIPEGDRRTRLFQIRLAAPNEGGSLLPGMSVVGLVPTAQLASTTLVPKDAILQGETGSHVFIDRGGVAEVVRVERLFAVGDLVAVRSGMLEAGMSVVVEGNERLMPMQPLNILGTSAGREDAAPAGE
jgi:multidrug efflux pump subunit AcrA (membrane-fusion protein)